MAHFSDLPANEAQMFSPIDPNATSKDTRKPEHTNAPLAQGNAS